MARTRSGRFSPEGLEGFDLAGRTLGVVGTGAIGRHVVRIARGFGMTVIAFDLAPDPALAEALGFAYAPMEALLERSDVVSLHVPARPAAPPLLDEAAFARMKPGALLINPARGSLVDETAVAAALTEGRLGGYAADTFELEDLSRPDRPREIPPALLAHPNTLFGAHIGSATVSARRAIEACAAENILDALAGRVPRDAINTIASRSP